MRIQRGKARIGLSDTKKLKCRFTVSDVTIEVLHVYVNPQMVTNSFRKRGFPKWDFFLLPTHF
jgi:hypothetical protein